MRLEGGRVVEAPERIEIESVQGVRMIGDLWRPAMPSFGAVLLLHGGGQTRHSWAATGRRLASQGWAALAIDARGHGESGWADEPPGYRFDPLIADLEAVVAWMGEPPVVLGASMGGLTALLAEGRRSGLLRALVLVDVTPTLAQEGVTKITDFMRAGLAGFDTLDEVADAVAAYNPHRQRTRNLDGLRKNLRCGADGRWYWHWDPRFMPDATGDHERGIGYDERRELAARVRVPTLLVRGRHSDVVTPEAASELLALIPGSRMVDAQDAGHMVAGDDNDVFTMEVERFLRSLPPRSPARA
jgi:pimeloyl-ACP methyl ester carboxylesterase